MLYQKRSRQTKARRAFTLVEILIVIALIAAVMGAAVYNYGNLFEGGQEKTEALKVKKTFPTALMGYRMDVGSYPSTEEGLTALLLAPEGKEDRWKRPYLNSAEELKDSWGKPYQYRFPGSKNPSGYDLWSLGPDGQDGTADDVGNWESGK